MDSDPQAENYFNRGKELDELGQYADAIAFYDKALKIDPSIPTLWYNRGNTLGKLDRYSDAIASYDLALKINSNYFNAWNNRGLALAKLNRYSDALESFDKALKIKPDHINAWANRGLVLVKLDRYSEALSSYDMALRIEPDNTPILKIRGIALDKIGQHAGPPTNTTQGKGLETVNSATATSIRCPACGADIQPKKQFCGSCGTPIPESRPCPSCGAIIHNTAKFCSGCGTGMGAECSPKVDETMVEDYSSRGVGLANLGQHAEATASFDQALRINPNNYEALRNRNVALDKLDRDAMTAGSPPSDRKICQNCGSPIMGDTVFCGKCGTPPGPVSIQQPNTKSPIPRPDMTALPITMFRANPQHTGEYDNGGLVLTNTVLWQFETGDFVSSSPAVSNGVVYAGSWDGNLYALDAVTGIEKWRFKTEGAVDISPAVSNGAVFIGGCNDKNLYALDAATGKELWRFKTEGEVYSSPTVSDGVVYFGSHDYHLYAVDVATGRVLWRFKTGNDVTSSPAVSNGVVYFGSHDKDLYALDAATGKEKWRFQTGGWVTSSPAVLNGVVYVGSDDARLYAINAVTGTEKWRFQTGCDVQSSPAVSNGIVYVGSEDGTIYAVDAATGKEMWPFTTGGPVRSSPAVANGTIYIGSMDKYLYAIDAVTGIEKWRFEIGSDMTSSPTVSNGVVYVGGSYECNLYAIGTYQPVLPQAGTEKVTGIKEKSPKLSIEPGPLVPVPENTSPPATPDLFVTIDQILLVFSTWNRMEVQITNTGKSHAFSAILSFSDDFQTRLIKPVTVEAGTTQVVEIGIMPKEHGTVPIEVTLQYKDESNHEYVTKTEFWVEVQPQHPAT